MGDPASMSVLPVLMVLVAVTAVLVALATMALLGSSISRGRVDHFARRQRLRLGAVNAPLVVRAIAITHRWRRAGLALGFLVGFAVAATQSRLSIDFGAMFIGWFAGAVVAEWRISALPVEGPRRSAALARRGLSTYVTAANRVMVGAAAALLTIGAAGAGTHAVRDHALLATWSSWVGVSLAALLTLALTVRRVVRRSLAHPDDALRQADDALRGHALTVLTGCAVAASGLPLSAFLAMVGDASGGSASGWAALGQWAMILLMVLGWYVASRSPSVRSRQLPVSERDPVGA